jgi:YD repeat-containing protein
VNLTRDGQDNVTAYQDPRTITTTYVRNGFGEVIQEASPDAGTTVLVRDQRGLVTQSTDGRGVVATMTYDAAGRLLTVSYPSDPSQDVTYAYDSTAGGNPGVGRAIRKHSLHPRPRRPPDRRGGSWHGGLHPLRRDLPYIMTKLQQLASPVMRRDAGLAPDPALSLLKLRS